MMLIDYKLFFGYVLKDFHHQYNLLGICYCHKDKQKIRLTLRIQDEIICFKISFNSIFSFIVLQKHLKLKI